MVELVDIGIEGGPPSGAGGGSIVSLTVIVAQPGGRASPVAVAPSLSHVQVVTVTLLMFDLWP
jgi:hypothetical protein